VGTAIDETRREPVKELQKRIGNPDRTVGRNLLWVGIGPGKELSITPAQRENGLLFSY
jgi:hypothetical protein